MKKNKQSAVFANLLADEFSSEEERAKFEREVALRVSAAELIRALENVRESQDVSKAEVARRIGTPRSVVSRLLSGETVNTNVATLASVADALGVYLDVKIKPQPRRTRHAPIEVHPDPATA